MPQTSGSKPYESPLRKGRWPCFWCGLCHNDSFTENPPWGFAPTFPGLLAQETNGLQPINVLLPVATQLVKPTVTREFPTN